MLFSGPRPFFYTYDLQQGTSTMHPRGLWGSGDIFDDSAVVSVGRRKRTGEKGGATSRGNITSSTFMHTAFSPCTGSLLAVAGRGGVVHLVDWKSGAGQVVGTLTCTSGGGGGGGGIQGLWWVPGGGKDIALGDRNGNGGGTAGDEKHLAVLTGEAEVYIWDVGQRRCVKRWKDEGGYRGAGRVLAGSGGVGSGWMAIGLVFFFSFLFFLRYRVTFFLSLLLSTVLQVDLSMCMIPILFLYPTAMLPLYLEPQN